MLILSSSTSAITKTYFPSPGFWDSLSESFSHPPELNLNPITPGKCQLIHLPPLMAVTLISTYQISVTAGMGEKQRYSYKLKTEGHSYWGVKIVTQRFPLSPGNRAPEMNNPMLIRGSVWVPFTVISSPQRLPCSGKQPRVSGAHTYRSHEHVVEEKWYS